MNLTILEDAINNGDIDKAIKIIEELGKYRNIQALPILIKHLKSTKNDCLRNAIALTLSDIGSSEAVEPIISIIKSPKTKGSRGTLLYALKSFDYSSHIEILVEIILKDNHESRWESFELLELNKNHIPKDVIKRCLDNINQELEEIEDRFEVISLTEELLKSIME